MKCLVCGEIFDSSIETCPVCGVGAENFVPVASQDTDFCRNTEERFVILGGGTAALQAAKASVGGAFKHPAILEFRGPLGPITIKTNHEDVKMVLPVRIREADDGADIS